MTTQIKTPKDYQWKYQGQNPLERLHDGEPYFFIRAQDSLASEAVQAYADLLKREQSKALDAGNVELSDSLLKQALGVLAMANSFLDWQQDHIELVKKPRVR